MNGTATPILRILDALGESARKTASGWQAKCPAHDDRNASLSISEARDGTVLIKCHAGCKCETICSAIGLAMRDLFPPRENQNGHNGHNGNGNARRIVECYDYRDDNGELVYQCVRYDPKDFRQRRPDGNGGFIWNLQDVTRVPFRLPELLNANENDPGGLRIIAEGEKDILRLAAEGFTATCNVGGAGKWKNEYNAPLFGCAVVIIADKDTAGRNHAGQVVASLHPSAASVKVIELPGENVKDASDWFDAGGTAEQLRGLIEAAPEWESEATKAAIEELASKEDWIEPAFKPVSAAKLLEGYKELKPEVICEILRETETANLVSTSKANKTHTAIDLALCVCTGRMWLGRFAVKPGNVLYIDAELHRQTFAHRLAKIAKARGILADEFGDKLDVLTLRGNLRDLFEMESFFRGIPKGKYKIIIIDALYRLLPRGLDENSNADITALYNRVDQYAELAGAAIICVHHSTKGNQSGKSPTEVGSGAGAQSRAVDAHIIMRAHAEDDAVVMEAALRSFPPLLPIGLRWQYPIFSIDESINTDNLREPGKRGGKRDTPNWTPENFSETFITSKPQGKATITVAAGKRGLKPTPAGLLLRAAVDAGFAFEWKTDDRRTASRFASIPEPEGVAR